MLLNKMKALSKITYVLFLIALPSLVSLLSQQQQKNQGCSYTQSRLKLTQKP